ncbi:MAG: ribonucleoside triphosphate reductase [Clostridia bacterium]|nr:ribonucleoside triphosphate reductase [Clostridia bacterium]
MVRTIVKRDGRTDSYDVNKIAAAINKAAIASNDDTVNAFKCADMVSNQLNARFPDGTSPTIEDIQDAVEKVLMEQNHSAAAKSYILYRERRKQVRESNALIEATVGMFTNYLTEADWNVKENANMQKSVNGLNNYIRETFTKKYWLNDVYPEEIRKAHEDGDLHLHDLGFFGPYCAGWDLKHLLLEGFGGVEGKVESKPAKHMRAFLGQVVNSTFTTQGETAGAQAWSSIDTYCAPFIKYDNMTYTQVKQCVQEFVFNMNVPTRVGFQCPFSNLTFDIRVPHTFAEQPVVYAGKYMTETYKEFQAEMDMFNEAFCEVMLAGDAKGRVFTFPIPTINITKDFDWNSPVVDRFMEITCKYGIPYFANYVNSDLSPEDAVSMCCRLRLDVRELRKRGGGLFGSNPMTGSIGVVTINMPRIGYTSRNENEFFAKLKHVALLAKNSLEIKRKIIEDQSNKGLYPYSTHYLRSVKERTGAFWTNHFNTIGIVGMNEALLNFMDKDIGTPEGLEFSIKVLKYLRELMMEFQSETGMSYNLEASPAEGTSYRLAKSDAQKFGGKVKASGKEVPYYTNSAQLPANYTDDIMECVRLQDEIQSLYTGGTVQHIYLGERINDINTCKKLIKKIFSNTHMPYISITPTFSICNDHGYIAGEHYKCPVCNGKTEIYSRVTGYLRPIENYNEGKKEEFKERVKFVIKNEQIDNVII